MAHDPDSKTKQWHQTACILCSINCGLNVQTDGDRRITKIIGDKLHPASKGYVCEKAQRLDYYQNGADRLTSPMKRMPDGSYKAIDWNTAISEVSAKMSAIRDQHGGDKILYYGGGGQGNHVGGAYVEAWLKALGVRYRSNALAQEKTGEFWVAGKMLGVGSHGDYEHCEVAMFLGKNPWQSHGFARTRAVIRDIVKDPERCLIVVDPRRTETAQKADYHLAVKPGTDAWLMAAMLGILIQENLVNHEWIADHTTGFEDIHPALADIDVALCAKKCGVDIELIQQVSRRIASAQSVSIFEDLGIQMSVNSTLVSYLQRLVWLTTGNYGRKGTTNAFVPFLSLGKASKGQTGGGASVRIARVSPVAGAKIIIGLIPCNVIPEEILCDHPDRYRGMIIQSGNPVHSLADSQRMREALRALECSVVIDVAMTETARQADYVLPSSSQYEKAEATFFNLEFPNNVFHLRQPLFEPLQGTLSEAEISARLLEEMGELTDKDYRSLRVAAKLGLTAFSTAFLAQMLVKPKLMKYVAPILYRTLGPTLAKGMETGAVLWGLSLMYVQSFGTQAKRAGFGGPAPIAANKLFKAIMSQPSGVVFSKSTYEESWQAIRRPGNRINLYIEEMISELGKVLNSKLTSDEDFPYVLSAGERRTDTANTTVRDTGWHKKGLYASLRMSPEDAASLNCDTGDRLKITTRRASAEVTVEVSDMMQNGHVSLPNGTGLNYVDEHGVSHNMGVAVNELTDASSRDFLAGTPWHKHVAAKLERV